MNEIIDGAKRDIGVFRHPSCADQEKAVYQDKNDDDGDSDFCRIEFQAEGSIARIGQWTILFVIRAFAGSQQ